jgi:hypothetical protein
VPLQVAPNAKAIPAVVALKRPLAKRVILWGLGGVEMSFQESWSTHKESAVTIPLRSFGLSKPEQTMSSGSASMSST